MGRGGGLIQRIPKGFEKRAVLRLEPREGEAVSEEEELKAAYRRGVACVCGWVRA